MSMLASTDSPSKPVATHLYIPECLCSANEMVRTKLSSRKLYCSFLLTFSSRLPSKYHMMVGGGMAVTGHCTSMLLPWRTWTRPPTLNSSCNLDETRFCWIACMFSFVGTREEHRRIS